MIPYIAILIVLIVAVLFAVYKRVDGFELMGIVVTENTKIQTILEYMKRYIELNKALKAKLDAGQPFDEPLTELRAKELGLSFSKGADGAIQTTKPLSKALSAQLELDVAGLDAIQGGFINDIKAGKVKRSMTLRQFMQSANPDQVKEGTPLDVSFLNEVVTTQVTASNAREALINKKLGGGQVAGVDVTDLYGAVGGVKEAIKSSTLDAAADVTASTKKQMKAVAAAAAPKASKLSTQEMEDRIANRVAKQMKNSMLAQRSTEEVYGGMPCPYAPVTSSCGAQGQEYTQAKPSSSPDMSQYIRKDSIPCWNCSLP
jgi:hypothetical protein